MPKVDLGNRREYPGINPSRSVVSNALRVDIEAPKFHFLHVRLHNDWPSDGDQNQAPNQARILGRSWGSYTAFSHLCGL
jgi:hypothetical protein